MCPTPLIFVHLRCSPPTLMGLFMLGLLPQGAAANWHPDYEGRLLQHSPRTLGPPLTGWVP